MNTRSTAYCLLVLSLLLSLAPSNSPRAIAATVVYDSLSSTVFGGGYILQPPGDQLGEDIILGYYSASIDKIEYMLKSFSTNTFVEFKIHLYAFDRPGGSLLPGSTLWSSPNISLVVPQTPQIYYVDVPDVIVPKRFGWAIETIAPSTTGVGFPGVPSPTIGKSVGVINYREPFLPNEPWRWERQLNPQAFGLRLTGTAIVIPEPSTWAVASLTAMSMIGFCRFRR